MLTLMLALLCQERVELKEYQSYYQLRKPADYSDRSSWPAVIDFRGDRELPEEPGVFVVSPPEDRDASFAMLCLTDLKTRYRVDPERVIVRGSGSAAPRALGIAESQTDLVAACILFRPRGLSPSKRAVRTVVYLGATDPDRGKASVSAMIMKKSKVEIEVRDAGDHPASDFKDLEAKLRPRGTIQAADEMQRAGRYLDASLLCIDLLDKPELQQLARTKLKSLEGVALIEMSKVEIAVADRKLKDAVLRCRGAAKQFAWLPTIDRIRKRLSELESRPDVQKALEAGD